MNEFDDLKDILVPSLQSLSGLELGDHAVDHRQLVRWLRYTTGSDSNPRLSLLDQLEREGQSSVLPDALNAALRTSHASQERTAAAARVRYAMILTSLPGSVSLLPPGLLTRLLDNGIWTADRALTATEQLTDPHLRTHRLTELARHTPRDHMLAAALRDAVKLCDPALAAGRDAILKAIPLLPREDRITALERLLPSSGRDRLAALLLLASALEPEHLSQVADLSRNEATLTKDEKTTTLALVYPALPAELKQSILPALIEAATPDAGAGAAAALTALLAHTDGSDYATLRAFVYARLKTPHRTTNSRTEMAVARLIHRAAASRLVPTLIAGPLLGWWLESAAPSSHEEFLPLAALATTNTGLPRRTIRVAAIACCISAPEHYRDVFPYSHGTDLGQSAQFGDLNAHVQAFVSTLPPWLLRTLRRWAPRAAAWWARRGGATPAEVRSVELIVSGALVEGSAGAQDLLSRSEQAQQSGLLEGDVRGGDFAGATEHLADHELERAAALLEKHGDIAKVLLAVAALLPHMRPDDLATYAPWLLEQAAQLREGAPDAVCGIITEAGTHLGNETGPALDLLWRIGRDIHVSSGEKGEDYPALLQGVAEACEALLPALPPKKLPRARRLLVRCPAGRSTTRGIAYLAGGREETSKLPTAPTTHRKPSRARRSLQAIREGIRATVTLIDPLEIAACLAVLAPLLPRWATHLVHTMVLHQITIDTDPTSTSPDRISEALTEVVRQDPTRTDDALRVARALGPTDLQVQALTTLLPHLPAPERQPLLDEIVNSTLAKSRLTDFGRVTCTAQLLPWTQPAEPLVDRLLNAVDLSWNAATQTAAYAAIAEHAPATLRSTPLDKGLKAAATLSPTTLRVEYLRHLAKIAADTPDYRGTDAWTALMCEGSCRSRNDFLADIRALAPLSRRAAGPKGPEAICVALQEVHRVWP
ncbi:hypothetical protein [Streptomyces sp. NPDC058305]|uniref:hypothetical protein n=1 Tax=Streptomyces sp. NPDC058305 TaxID=3346438 RepID=UPI0036F0F2E3